LFRYLVKHVHHNFKLKKMKKVIVSLAFLLLLVPTISAQDEEETTVENPKSSWSDKFFLAFTASTYTDLIISPLQYHYALTGNTDQAGNPTTANIPFQSLQYNIISLGIEPRYNLKEFDDNTAITLAAPVSFGIGTTGPVDNIKVQGVSGFGSLQIPLIMKLFIGNGSTYRTQKDFGFNIGGGFEFNKIGLINLSGETNKNNSPFIMPCITTGIVLMRGDTPMEINFKYGFSKFKTQDTNGQGDLLLDSFGVPTTRTVRGQTLKLSFVYLMNY
jgi:hypothetical protein